MQAAKTLPRFYRMMHLNPQSHHLQNTLSSCLPKILKPGDLLVVNDAATLPASIHLRSREMQSIEIRLAQHLGKNRWKAIAFGAGDWRQDTNRRPAPPQLQIGEELDGPQGLHALLTRSQYGGRLITLTFLHSESELLEILYTSGQAIQYSYHHQRLPLSWLQLSYAGRPWAVEMPSAGRAITWSELEEVRARGINIARLTHAAGLSATGLAELDAQLPFAEHYEIPRLTAELLLQTRDAGARIIAVGTSVVRAIEGHALNQETKGEVFSEGMGWTDLVIGPDFSPKFVSGVLSGIHAAGESHFQLLSAFADPEDLRRAFHFAQSSGYKNHELGDLLLLLS